MFIRAGQKKAIKQIYLSLGLGSFIIFGSIPVYAQDVVFPQTEEKWKMPEDFSDEQKGDEPDVKNDVPEAETPDFTPPLVMGTRAWKSTQEVMSQDVAPDFSDEVTHWKKIENIKDSDCSYETVLEYGKGGEVASRIRFSLLPSPDIHAVDDVIISKPKFTVPEQQTELQKTVLQKKKEQELTNEACDAMSKVKKRQLDAIESDRRTLNALKEALKDLGLVKKLSFITQDEAGVSASSNVPVDFLPKQ